MKIKLLKKEVAEKILLVIVIMGVVFGSFMLVYTGIDYYLEFGFDFWMHILPLLIFLFVIFVLYLIESMEDRE